MAPTLSALLEAAEGRCAELEAEDAGAKAEMAALDQEIADKRAERTIAAQNAVRELLKQKETLMKKCRLVGAALGHVQLAVSKLQRTKAAGLEDWKDLREEKVKLSTFAEERLKDAAAVAQLQADCAGATVTVAGASVAFVGSSAGLEGLKQALARLESGYSVTLDVEPVLLGIMDRRNALQRQSEKHGVEIAKGAGNVVTISGAVDKVNKAKQALQFFLGGKVDLYCPKALAGAARAEVKELEADTGCFADVLRGGFGGGSIVHLRGDAESVKEAEERMRAWIDEREGKVSIFVDVPRLAKLDAAKAREFAGDLSIFAGNFGIDAWCCEEGVPTRVELRGAADGAWQDKARAEFKQLTDWYAQQAEEAAKPKAQPKVEEDDGWGAAPEAEFELGHKW